MKLNVATGPVPPVLPQDPHVSQLTESSTFVSTVCAGLGPGVGVGVGEAVGVGEGDAVGLGVGEGPFAAVELELANPVVPPQPVRSNIALRASSAMSDSRARRFGKVPSLGSA